MVLDKLAVHGNRICREAAATVVVSAIMTARVAFLSKPLLSLLLDVARRVWAGWSVPDDRVVRP